MLDQGTLFFVLALLFGLLGVVCGALRVGFGSRVKGIGTWALALGGVAVASSLLAAGFAHGRLAVVVQNLFWVPTMVLTAVAARQFHGRVRRLLPLGSLALVVFLLAAVASGEGSETTVRLLLLATFHVFCAGVALHAVWQAPPPRWSLGRSLMMAGLLLTMLLQGLRAGLVIAQGGEALSFLNRAGEVLIPWFLVLMLVSLLMVTLGFVLSSADRIRADLEALASNDPLTGLLNRRGFHAHAAALFAFAKRQGKPMALALIDIDDFKRINDERGHEVGDTVLASLGRLLLAQVRGQDLAARFGGEEFVVLLPVTDAAGAQVWAERLRESIERGLAAGGGAVTASIGLCVAEAGAPWADLYRGADAALYEAKAQGKNRVVFAGPAALPQA